MSAKVAVTALKAIPTDFGSDEVGRLAVVAAARNLLSRLQTPSEQAWSYMFNHPVVFASIQALRDLGIWEAWKAAGGGEKTVDELAAMAKTTITTELLGRLLKLLAADDVIAEVDSDKYTSTPFSAQLGEELGLLIQCGTDHYLDMGFTLPKFLKETGYKESTDRKNTAYSNMATNPQHLEFFERWRTDPRMYASFSAHMADWTRSKPDWTSTFDTTALLAGADLVKDGSAPFVVDMGGHHGVDISRVLARHPHLPSGALVLQDLPQVVAVADTKVDKAKIQTMPHDIFTPQPVANSRVYFMHAVLHDWPDDAVLKIFEQLKPAMKKGYSKLLINDIVVPATSATLPQTVMDVQMMGLLAAKERSQASWTEVLTKGGFTGIKFHKDIRGYECVIEADLA